jgi:hypothetical protein
LVELQEEVPAGILKAATSRKDGWADLSVGHSNIWTGTLLRENKELTI